METSRPLFTFRDLQDVAAPARNSYLNWRSRAAPTDPDQAATDYSFRINSITLSSSGSVGTSAALGTNSVGQPAGQGISAAWEPLSPSTASIEDARVLIRSGPNYALSKKWDMSATGNNDGKLVTDHTGVWIDPGISTVQTPINVTFNANNSGLTEEQ
ncbi:MAG TPA: hypothetical protein VES73_12070, partial [Lamprocystis sp. (in: g-proteobacteria)]|nr:hypothetical protein [Lamprocystis sp. (in: g-proteobacteria)]